MTRGTTLVASASTSHSCIFGEHACGLLATQQGTTIMPSCLITEHEPDRAYLKKPASDSTFGQWLRSDFRSDSRCPLSPYRARSSV